MREAKITILFLLFLLTVSVTFIGCQQSAPEEAQPQVSDEPPPPPKARPGDWVTIPAGEFKMGSDQRPESMKNKVALSEPEHVLELPEYKINVFEVTNAEYARFQIEGDYPAEGNWRQFYSLDKGDFPVANVTWDDAKAYCEWIGGRLPTEAEWEKAARGPNGYPYPWGDHWDPTKSNCNEMGYSNLVETGRMATDVNEYGVHDTMGNVTEWTSDKLSPYPGNKNRRDPNYRRGYITVRGGSYAIKGGSFFLWTRGAYLPKSQYGIGFRCVMDVEQEGGEEAAN
jgi:formylglycine-generating enzyme required for sulfatase activity